MTKPGDTAKRFDFIPPGTPEYMSEETAKARGIVETFSLILCCCSQAYVRSNYRGSDWSCPACGEADDVDNLHDVPGPARDKVGVAEFNVLCGFNPDGSLPTRAGKDPNPL